MENLPFKFKQLFCFLILIANTFCLQEFKARQVKLSPEASLARKNYLDSILQQRNPNFFARKKRMEMEIEYSSVSVTETKFLLTGNITVGTPPQTFLVEFDPFYTRDLNLIDSEANFKVYGDVPPKHTFNSSASSTYLKKDGSFTYEGTGHIGSDTVNIGGLSTTMTFGLLDKVGYRYQSEPVDGLLGLYLSPSFNNMTNAAVQFAGQLEKPVVSVWINSTLSGDGSATFTFGAENTKHCDSLSGFVPLKEIGYSFGFHLSTATTHVNGFEISVGMNDTVHIVPWQEYIYCERKFLDVLVNASGAVYNSSYGRYNVDCAAKKTSQVILSIGGEGNTPSSNNKQIFLTGADYIEYDTRLKTCFLSVISAPWYQDFVELGINFLHNHCFTYNLNDNTIAFSNVK